MKMRKTPIRKMSQFDTEDYIYDLEAEVHRLRDLSRIHRKSMREMQAKLEKNNLLESIKKEQEKTTYIIPYPWDRPVPLTMKPYCETVWGETRITCDTTE